MIRYIVFAELNKDLSFYFYQHIKIILKNRKKGGKKKEERHESRERQNLIIIKINLTFDCVRNRIN